MPLEVRATANQTVTIKIYQGASQVGADIATTESGTLAGYYSAPYPQSLAAGEYRVEASSTGSDGDVDFIPYAFFWDGSAEITMLTLFNSINAIDGGSGGSGTTTAELSTAERQLLQEARDWAKVAKDGVKGRYVKNGTNNTGTLFDENNSPVVVFDLKGSNGTPSSTDVYQRIPR